MADLDGALLDLLEEQHRMVEGLFAKLEKAEEAKEQMPLVEQLATALGEHMQIEERDVYPALAELDGEMGKEAQVEHGLARTGLEQLQGLIGQPGFGAGVAMLKAGIEHHVEEEEEEAFPKLRTSLGLTAGPGGGATKDELYEAAKAAGIEGRSSMTKAELAKAVASQ